MIHSRYASIAQTGAPITVPISNTEDLFAMTSGFNKTRMFSVSIVGGHRLKLSTEGIYFISWSASIKLVTGANDCVFGGVIVNNDSMEETISEGEIDSNNDQVNLAGTAVFVPCSEDDEVLLGFGNKSTTTDLLVSKAKLALFKINTL